MPKIEVNLYVPKVKSDRYMVNSVLRHRPSSTALYENIRNLTLSQKKRNLPPFHSRHQESNVCCWLLPKTTPTNLTVPPLSSSSSLHRGILLCESPSQFVLVSPETTSHLANSKKSINPGKKLHNTYLQVCPSRNLSKLWRIPKPLRFSPPAPPVEPSRWMLCFANFTRTA